VRAGGGRVALCSTATGAGGSRPRSHLPLSLPPPHSITMRPAQLPRRSLAGAARPGAPAATRRVNMAPCASPRGDNLLERGQQILQVRLMSSFGGRRREFGATRGPRARGRLRNLTLFFSRGWRPAGSAAASMALVHVSGVIGEGRPPARGGGRGAAQTGRVTMAAGAFGRRPARRRRARRLPARRRARPSDSMAGAAAPNCRARRTPADPFSLFPSIPAPRLALRRLRRPRRHHLLRRPRPRPLDRAEHHGGRDGHGSGERGKEERW